MEYYITKVWSLICCAWHKLFTVNVLSFVTASFSAYAAFMSYSVANTATMLSLRLANDQVIQQKPQVALISGVVTLSDSNVEDNKYVYLLEIKLKNSGARSAMDFGFSMQMPDDASGEVVVFDRNRIDKDIEYSVAKTFETRGPINLKDRKIGRLALAYADKYPVYNTLNQGATPSAELQLEEKCAGVSMRSIQFAKSDQPNKWVVIIESNLIPSLDPNVNKYVPQEDLLRKALGSGDTERLCRQALAQK
jgi:hypothetical protein